MTTALVTPDLALQRTQRSLGLHGAFDRNALIGAALRRAGGVMAPCRPGELTRSVWASLEPLAGAGDLSQAHVEEVLEALLMIGDFVELSFIDGQGREVTRICLIPPAFVSRADTRVILLGGSDEEAWLLPKAINERIVHRGARREIVASDDEDLAAQLREFGLQEIAAEAWLRLPRQERPETYVAVQQARIKPVNIVEDIEGLTIIGEGRSYMRRWCTPGDQTGLFVARRPQRYGHPIWCAVLLEGGKVVGLADLHAPGSLWRPCDVAWQLQMALDAMGGRPHAYRCVQCAQGQYWLDVFAPIPSWAERRLQLVGERGEAPNSLARYVIPAESAGSERTFLQNYLWMREGGVA